ncbi:hypothetical protein [Microbacterium sp. gxy059]|uniref:hypothetical protein n=1 Tax=Microbacterium sp. gxy059 TaxID=2957199 RepID=UPI003D96496E
MTTTRHTRILAAFGAIALVPAALAACSGGADEPAESPAEEQPAEETPAEETPAEEAPAEEAAGGDIQAQCAAASSSILEATSGMGDISTMMAEQDVEGITQLISEIDAGLAEAGNEITDADLKATYEEFSGQFSTIASGLEKIAADPTSEEAQAAVSEMTDAQAKLQEAGAAFQEACS